MRGTRRLPNAALVLALVLGGPKAAWSQPPVVAGFRKQTIDDTVYFQVRFAAPDDYRLAPWERNWTYLTAVRPLDVGRPPRLVPQDGGSEVHLLANRLTFPDAGAVRRWFGPPQTADLEFVGRTSAKARRLRFLLLYPSFPKSAARKELSAEDMIRGLEKWREVEIDLDPDRATTVPVPAQGFRRPWGGLPHPDDLEGWWALSRGAHFALLEAHTPEFGFYTLARETTGRRHGLLTPPLARFPPGKQGSEERAGLDLLLGTSAIARLLALDRLGTKDFTPSREERTVEAADLTGIGAAPHEWKSAPKDPPGIERLAEFTPRDNWYLHFRTMREMQQGERFFEEFGTAAGWLFDGRKHLVKERLEEQLCLKTIGLTRLLGPTVVRDVALTGSDPFVREGSDVTVMFRTRNLVLFLDGVDPVLQLARRKWGEKMQVAKQRHRGTVIESYVTPGREVSLHRAIVGEVALFGNSLPGLKRALDAQAQALPRLGDAPDFQHLRRRFPAADLRGDALLFLSEAFLRRALGPEVVLGEKRRLEALTSLHLATHGALLAAWETGRLPRHHNEMLARTGLRAEELFCPGGAGAFWDPVKQRAVSDVYGTLRFATPLLEVPLGRITPTEQRDYEGFRKMLDPDGKGLAAPVGIRFHFTENETTLDLAAGALANLPQFRTLRRLVGTGTVRFDPQGIGNALGQLVLHLDPASPDLQQLELLARLFFPGFPGFGWLGDRAELRLEDDPALNDLLERRMRADLLPAQPPSWFSSSPLRALELPLTVGLELKSPKDFPPVLEKIRRSLAKSAFEGNLTWEKNPLHRDIPSERVLFQGRKDPPPGEVLFHSGVVRGTWYLAPRFDSLQAALDRNLRSDAKDTLEVQASLHLAPGMAVRTRPGWQRWLEHQSRLQTLGTGLMLTPLYRAGVLPDRARGVLFEETTLKFLGAMPGAPDGYPFGYDRTTDDVLHLRHGSVRRPLYHAVPDAATPPGKLLGLFRFIRADLRFQRDGTALKLTLRKR